MLTFFQAILLGALQGITELFPISSLGHTVILPSLFGWRINQTDPFFVSFLVLTHLATALVLLGFFFTEWVEIVKGFIRSLIRRSVTGDAYAKLSWLLFMATIPAGLAGLLLQKKFEALFALPVYASSFLIANGFMLLIAEYFSRRRGANSGADDDRIAARLSLWSAIGIGVAQCLALLPGFSRTGATLSGGLYAGLNRSDAGRFSFLLATPIIFAAALLKVPHLVLGGGTELSVALAGALSAALFAYLSVRYLTKYFKTNSLTPFGIYCIVAGILAILIIG